MKTTLLRRSLLLLTLGSALLAPALSAADATPPPPPQHGPGGPRGNMFDPEKRLARLTEELKLTAEQQAKIRPILVAQVEEMKAANITALPEDQRREKMNQLRQSQRAALSPILTPEQIKILADMRGPGGDRGPRGERGNQPPPAPAPVPAN